MGRFPTTTGNYISQSGKGNQEGPTNFCPINLPLLPRIRKIRGLRQRVSRKFFQKSCQTCPPIPSGEADPHPCHAAGSHPGPARREPFPVQWWSWSWNSSGTIGGTGEPVSGAPAANRTV